MEEVWVEMRHKCKLNGPGLLPAVLLVPLLIKGGSEGSRGMWPYLGGLGFQSTKRMNPARNVLKEPLF